MINLYCRASARPGQEAVTTATYALAVAMVAANIPTDNVTLFLQGGREIGQDGDLNPVFAHMVSWGTHKLIIQTDPLELTTPAIVLGRINWGRDGDLGGTPPEEMVTIKQIKHYGTFSNLTTPIVGQTGSFGSGGIWGRYDNNFSAFKFSSAPGISSAIFGPSNGTQRVLVNGCTIALVGAFPNHDDGKPCVPLTPANNINQAKNSLIISYYDGDLGVRIAGDSGSGCVGLTGFNYYPEKTIRLRHSYNYPTYTPPGAIEDVDPVLTSPLITVAAEDPALIIARDFNLTALSTPCLDNADPTSSNATDIFGVLRPQGTVADRGCAELAAPVVSDPTIDPNGGSFIGSQEVALACETEGAEIRYTTNGSTPTEASSLYSTPFTITDSATVKAKAFKEGSDPSNVVSAEFVEGVYAPPVPYFPLQGGDVTSYPEFVWTDPTNVHFQLQVAHDLAFSTLVINELVSEKRFASVLSLMRGYYWRVRGRTNVSDWSAWSAVQFFNLTAQDAPPAPAPSTAQGKGQISQARGRGQAQTIQNRGRGRGR